MAYHSPSTAILIRWPQGIFRRAMPRWFVCSFISIAFMVYTVQSVCTLVGKLILSVAQMWSRVSRTIIPTKSFAMFRYGKCHEEDRTSAFGRASLPESFFCSRHLSSTYAIVLKVPLCLGFIGGCQTLGRTLFLHNQYSNFPVNSKRPDTH